ncbi:hypothetical protein BAUCODRAFT_101891 [Baudoinia panamericana UAMH 10762]|uniref:ENTH domain-containing protein n=1 Tax=Baudoinia panamericana (strain UAMH 10762) TaxID=717646 RepID=M2NK44_BAUPA|nr:uncharacterized protein BAUCODRAFT_101891 [Baudoinia panamericana UAMH 10762]EMC99804.1 hypothetical protein BAUCODRAFT_101891 [Baudoinia panamericana UAMH 10762]
MDWNDIRNQVSNLSLYDVKAGIRKVQNAVMNYTEMEAKVREATNNEPWGASSTLMQEIANATSNYQQLNEIMPMIYKRFTEKSAEEWRQIYKALQLMEFLVKNGSERVIDDARSHLSLLKMLRQFHYIDPNGKDQGINVRNRSKELTDLLSDVEKIRAERKKARGTRNKYSGHEGGGGLGMSGSSSASRYGGFGSESGSGVGAGYGGATRGVYGDGGGFGGESNDDYDEPERRGGAEQFEEYNEFDDGGAQAPPGRRKADQTASARRTPKKEPVKPKAPEVDLFDFGDEPAAPSNGTAAASSSASAVLSPPAPTTIGGDDDDFDDFQSATPAPAAPTPSIPKPNYSSLQPPVSTASPSSTTQFAQPSPQPGSQQANFSNIFSTTSPLSASGTSTSTGPNYSAFSPPPVPVQQQSSGYQPSGPNYFTSVQSSASASGSGVTSPAASVGGRSTAAAKKPAAGGDAFASLLSGSGMKKAGTPTQKGPTIADMAKQKSQAGLYGANAPAAMPTPASSNGTNPAGSGSSGLDDLLG